MDNCDKLPENTNDSITHKRNLSLCHNCHWYNPQNKEIKSFTFFGSPFKIGMFKPANRLRAAFKIFGLTVKIHHCPIANIFYWLYDKFELVGVFRRCKFFNQKTEEKNGNPKKDFNSSN